MTILIFLLMASVLRAIPMAMLMKYMWQFRRLQEGDLGQVRKVIFYIAATNFLSVLLFTTAIVLAMFEVNPERPELYVIVLFCLPAALVAFVDWWAFYKVRQISNSG